MGNEIERIHHGGDFKGTPRDLITLKKQGRLAFMKLKPKIVSDLQTTTKKKLGKRFKGYCK